jgi:hypothetical protein
MERRCDLDTRLIGIERGATVTEVAAKANDLIGQPVPGYPGFTVLRIIKFQMSPRLEGYDALLLVEVIENQEQLNLKADDIEAIVEIASVMDDPEQTT